MGEVVLIHPQNYNPSKSALIWPPLGLCRIASYLEKRGHEVKIIEDALEKWSMKEIIEEIGDCKFIGIGAMTLQSPRAKAIAESIRYIHPKKIIIGGGAHFTSYQMPYNAIVVGDGEKSMAEILEKDFKHGVYHGEPVPYEPIDFKWIDYGKYGDHLIDGTRAISILTSRGCPFDCKFCGSPTMFGRKVKYYPVADVVNNMVELSEKYGIKAFRIMDDSFTVNRRWVWNFCRFIRDYGFRMACLTHANSVDRETLEVMKETGFEFIAIGVESGSDEILKLCNKNITIDGVKRAVEIIKSVGLKVEALFMLGLPGETSGTLLQSYVIAQELKADRTHFQYFTPFPGCEFYDEIRQGKHGHIIDHDFNNYHHRKPTFLPHTISYDDLVEGATMCMEAGNV